MHGDEDIDDIIDNFNFITVEKVMKALNWEWVHVGVPTIDDLKQKARELLKRVRNEILIVNEEEYTFFVSTGGFVARSEKIKNIDKIYLRLSFEIDAWGNYE
jgi:hypothetical protein